MKDIKDAVNLIQKQSKNLGIGTVTEYITKYNKISKQCMHYKKKIIGNLNFFKGFLKGAWSKFETTFVFFSIFTTYSI